ncbi:phage tail terminator protein [Vreelandella venusta]|uniref:phage tail terminator protein n=1 Tax=Vreelandella venusta TaxID=44935 RepID=UPI003F670E47
MLSLMPWVERLNALPGPAVQLAADVEAAQNAKAQPSRMLVLGRDPVEHQDMSNGAKHKVTPQVLLVTGIARRNLPMGNTDDELAGLRGPPIGSLMNWIPPGCDSAIKWKGGQLLSLKSHALFWVDVFTTEYWWKENET